MNILRGRIFTRALLGAGLPLTAALLFWGRQSDSSPKTGRLVNNSGNGRVQQQTFTSQDAAFHAYDSSTVESAHIHKNNSNRRTRTTPADTYFTEKQLLPRPAVMHAVLPLPRNRALSKASTCLLVQPPRPRHHDSLEL